jgi:hypothetical protein
MELFHMQLAYKIEISEMYYHRYRNLFHGIGVGDVFQWLTFKMNGTIE